MHRVIEIRVLEGYTLELRFEDQTTKAVDLRPYIGEGVSAPLADDDYFRQVQIDSSGGIAWPNGYDFCPNYLYDNVPSIDTVPSHPSF